MNTKHTPGPWKNFHGAIVPSGAGTLIATCASDNEQHEANARLIAAAPELLEAADFTLHHIIAGLSAGTQPEPQMLAEAHRRLHAAIAKATGQNKEG